MPPLSVQSGRFSEELHDLDSGLVAMPTEVRSHKKLLLRLGQVDKPRRIKEACRVVEGWGSLFKLGL